jgi:hypothetical protein
MRGIGEERFDRIYRMNRIREGSDRSRCKKKRTQAAAARAVSATTRPALPR